jgi:hypothetical protein
MSLTKSTVDTITQIPADKTRLKVEIFTLVSRETQAENYFNNRLSVYPQPEQTALETSSNG